MKKVIQGIILTIQSIFEAVFIIGGIGATVDSKIQIIECICFVGTLVCWLAVSFIGFIEINDGRKFIILPGLGIKVLFFLFFMGILGIFFLDSIEFGLASLIISIIALIPTIIYKIKHRSKIQKFTPPTDIFKKYDFDGFRAKHHWDDAAMSEFGETKVIDENSDRIYYLASTYFSYLLVWLMKNRLTTDGFISMFGGEFSELANDNPTELFMECTDGNFAREDLTEDGKSFLDTYYYHREYLRAFNPSYETDYIEIVKNQNQLNIYHDFSWIVYHQFESVLDRRYKYYLIQQEYNREEEERTYNDSGEHIFSETFAEDVEIIAYQGVSEEYKQKCINHIKNMPQICYNRIYDKIDELWGFDEGTDRDVLRTETSCMTVVIPKPYGKEIAYILEFEADFEPEHGVSVIIRNDVVLDIGIRAESDTPWSWESEIKYRYETSGT